MVKAKKLSSPSATGSAGPLFEANVQTSFVTLMLTGGFAPCLPCWPIKEVMVQSKFYGYETDDLTVIIEEPKTKEQRKLYCQAKLTISINENSPPFGEVIKAAWDDFNSKKFNKGKDAIALITGPINATDRKSVSWLLEQARNAINADDFYMRVNKANFSPRKSSTKLAVIEHHLKAANNDRQLSEIQVFDFMKHFHLLGYDLDIESGVTLSLLHSHISQVQSQSPINVWCRLHNFVQNKNKNAGPITINNLPQDILDTAKPVEKVQMPEALKNAQPDSKPTSKPRAPKWNQIPDATFLARAALLGAWDEDRATDRNAVSQFLGISYEQWSEKSLEILNYPESPLSVHNKIWRVSNREELLKQLSPRIVDNTLEELRVLAVGVLSALDPAFELPPEERYAAGVYGKTSDFSNQLRQGVAEGVAILNSKHINFSNCSHSKAEETRILAIRKIFADDTWALWGSLNKLLPTLAEAAPDEFLSIVEGSLKKEVCPFAELFAQESTGITGNNYLTGLFWALESLAWSETYFIRACLLLAGLAKIDPGGRWANRPINSLATILLPWMPQTQASIEKRKASVKTLFKEYPEVAWELIIQLLPNRQQTSSGSHKPKWLLDIESSPPSSVSRTEYWEQASYYAELAVAESRHDITRLSALIQDFDNLTQPALEKLIQALKSDEITNLPEKQRLPIWEQLRKFTNKHRKFSDAQWALPEKLINRIESAQNKLAPNDPLNLYRHLFSEHEFELYEEKGDYKEQSQKIEVRREAAISEIMAKQGFEGIDKFSCLVGSPELVGRTLTKSPPASIVPNLLPEFLDTTESSHKALIGQFVLMYTLNNGFNWCEELDISAWTTPQKVAFLSFLPFTEEAWKLAGEWLGANESKYWLQTPANPYQADSSLAPAVEKLLAHKRPHAAIRCLYKMLHDKVVDEEQCVKALLAALNSKESHQSIDSHKTTELIKFLQNSSTIDKEDLLNVEWGYVGLLYNNYSQAKPKFLWKKLAKDPSFFCEIIRLVYKSTKEESIKESSQQEKEIATNAWRLLYNWNILPGIDENGYLDEKSFKAWIQSVRVECVKSGHIKAAEMIIGEVLIHAPADPDGMWIHRAAATVLNEESAEDIRRGYETAELNSRGVHTVDPTGKPEKDLAKKYKERADELENNGFYRIAVTLRSLATHYERWAERIIGEHQQWT